MKGRNLFLFLFFLSSVFSPSLLGVIGCSGGDKGGDGEKKKCRTILDCQKNEDCLNGVCTPKSDVGGPCGPGLNDVKCLPYNSDGKKLICVNGVCKIFCETNFDCDPGEICNTSTGICEKRDDAGDSEFTPEQSAKKGEGEKCGPGEFCKAGYQCVKLSPKHTDGKCWKECKSDKDCKSGKVCSSGFCVPYAEKCQMSGGQLTQPCWPGLKCVLEGISEGSCYRQCAEAKDCPGWLNCTKKAGGNYCLPPQNLAGPNQPCGNIGGKQVGCVDGYECVPERTGSKKEICTKKCKDDTDCAWPRFCQANLCVLGTVGTAKLNATCKVSPSAADSERCDGGLFCLAVGNSKTGVCYRDCKSPRAPNCPAGTTCLAFSGGKLCFKTCNTNSDCPTETPTCGQLQGSTQKVCLPKQ